METTLTTSTMSLGQAARHCGVSKGTLSKAISSGKLSATRRPDSSWAIDGSELARYIETNGHRFRPQPVSSERLETADPTIAEVKARAELAEQRLADLKEQVRDLREQRDRWETVATRLTLSDRKPAKQSLSLWRWLRTAS